MLIINIEKPAICPECPASYILGAKSETRLMCGIGHKIIGILKGDEWSEESPSWCPLKEPKKGVWEKKVDDTTYWYECSECHERPPLDRYGHEWKSSYCPCCGANMVTKELICD